MEYNLVTEQMSQPINSWVGSLDADGKRDGFGSEYDQSGRVTGSGTCSNGYRVGVWQFFGSNQKLTHINEYSFEMKGQLVKTIVYQKGIHPVLVYPITELSSSVTDENNHFGKLIVQFNRRMLDAKKAINQQTD